MAIIERVGRGTDESQVQWLLDADEQFIHGIGDIQGDAEMLTADTALDDLEYVIYSGDTPPLGLYGFGLFHLRAGDLLPAAVVMPELVFGEPVQEVTVSPLLESPAASFVQEVFGAAPDGAVVVTIPPPRDSQVAVVGTTTGTLGVPVTLADGRSGALTAGHVAPTEDMTVDVGPGLEGNVAYTNYRQLHAHPTATADVAAIALRDDWRDHVPQSHLPGLAEIHELDKLRALNRSGTGSGGERVILIHDRLAVDKHGAWAEIALVDPTISIGGDSGAVVVNEAGLVVGQIVGGHPPAFSVVQEIDLLLSDSQTTFDP